LNIYLVYGALQGLATVSDTIRSIYEHAKALQPISAESDTKSSEKDPSGVRMSTAVIAIGISMLTLYTRAGYGEL